MGMTILGKRRTVASGYLCALLTTTALVSPLVLAVPAVAVDYTGGAGAQGPSGSFPNTGCVCNAGQAGGSGGANGFGGGNAASGGTNRGYANSNLGGGGGGADGGGGGGAYYSSGAGGPGGGAGGAGYLLTDGDTLTSGGAITGGNGGGGGYNSPYYGPGNYSKVGGGGGGGGGSGVIVTGTVSFTNTGTILGGTGGTGAPANYADFSNTYAHPEDAGSGGAGGFGVRADGATSLTLNNSGNITGGSSGNHAFIGQNNAGGAGIYGQNITLNNTGGTIKGGHGSTAGAGIELTGGINTLNIIAGGITSDSNGLGIKVDGGTNAFNISGGSVTPGSGAAYAMQINGGTNTLNVTGGTLGAVYLGGGTTTLEGTAYNNTMTLAHGATASVTSAGGDVSGITSFDNHGGLSLDAGRSLTLGAFTNESDGTLTLNAGATLVSTNLNLIAGSTITGAGSLSSGSAAYSLSSGAISAALAGSGGLTKTGSGTLTLTGANSYTGGTNINGGTLAVAFGALGGGDVHMAQGTSIKFTGGSFITGNNFFINGDPVFNVASGTQTVSGVIADDTVAVPAVPGVVEKTGAGELLLTGANTYSGGTVISAGTLTVGVGSTLDTNFALVSSAIGLGTLTLDGGTLATNAFYTVYNDILVNSTGGTIDSGANFFQVYGDITNGAGGPGTLTIAGSAGGAVILGGTNSYSGATVVNAGATLQPGSPDALSVNSAYTVTGTLNLREFGGGTSTIKSMSGTGTVKNDLAGNSVLHIATASGQSATFDGQITDGGGGNPHIGIAIEGLGTQVFTNASNNYSGGTFLTGGTLQITDVGALGRGPLTFGGGTLATNGGTFSNGITLDAGGGTINTSAGQFLITTGITGTGSLTVAGTGLTYVMGGLFQAGGTIINSGATLGLRTEDLQGDIANAGTLNIDGDVNSGYAGLLSGNGAVSLSGLGSLRLDNTANSFSGPLTVNGGQLVVTSDAVLGNVTSLTLNNSWLDTQGAVTLGASRTITLATAGKLQPDNGTLTVNGKLTGSGELVLSDYGTVVLTNGANDYSGGTWVLYGGVLSVSADHQLGDSNGDVKLGQGTLRATSDFALASTRDLILDSSTYSTIDVAAGKTLSFAGTVTEASVSALNVTGGGTLQLYNAGNDYSGGTVVRSGSALDVDADGELGNANGGVTLDDGTLKARSGFTLGSARTLALGAGGGTLMTAPGTTLTVASTVTGGALTIAGSGTVILDNIANDYSGGTNVSSGTLALTGAALGGGAVTMAQGTKIVFGGTFSVANNFFLSGDPVFDVNTGHSAAVSGVIADDTISGVPGVVEKTGAGELVLSGANTYSGGTILSAGTLTVGTDDIAGVSGALGLGDVTLDSGVLSTSGAHTIGNGILVNSTGGTIDSAGNSFEVLGSIADGSGAPGTLTIAGTGGGTVLLDGANTYTGPTVIAAGATLQPTSAGALSASSDYTVNGSLNVGSGGNGATIRSLAGTGTVENSLGGDSMLHIATGSGQTATFDGQITENGGGNPHLGIAIEGQGTQVFTNAGNNYSGGTVLTSGILEIADAGALGSGHVVFNGGTLKLDGGYTLYNDIQVDDAGGTLDIAGNNVTLNGDLSEIGSGTGYLSVSGYGAVTLNGHNYLSGGTAVEANGSLTVANAFALGGGTVALGTASTIAFINGSSSFNNAFTLDGDPIFDVASGLTTALTGIIADAPSPALPGMLEKTGTGTLVLSGANTYSGGTTLSDGTLQVGVDTVGTPGSITSSAIGTGALAFDGGTLQAGGDYTLANAIDLTSHDGTIDANGYAFVLTGVASGAQGLTFTDSLGGGSVTVSAASTYAGNATIDGTTVILRGGSSGPSTGPLGGGTIVLNGGTLEAGVSDFLVNAIALDANGGTLRAGSNSYFFGPISDNGGTPGGLTIGAAGDIGTVVLAAGSTYTGGTIIAGGVARVTADDSFGDPSGFVTINDGATAQYDDTVNIANTLLLHGGTAMLSVTSGTATQSGDILEDAPSSLEKTGAGTLVIGGDSNYSGATTILEGTLQASIFDAIPYNSDVQVASGATLAIDGSMGIVDIGSLGDHAGAGGTVTVGSFTDLYVGGVSSNSNNTTFSGVLTADSLTYDGAGTLTLSGSSNTVDQLYICSCVITGGITVSGNTMTTTAVNVEAGTFTVADGATFNTSLIDDQGAVVIKGASTVTMSAGGGAAAVITGTSTDAATLTVSEASTLTVDNLVIFSGNHSWPTPIVTASGAGTILSVTNGVFIGNPGAGPGILTAADGATLTTPFDISMDSGSTLNIGSGGTAGIVDAPSITGYSGSDKIVADFTDTSTLSAQIGGSVALTQQGSGTLILAAANSYSGATTISGGTLQVGNGGTLGSGAVVNNATLVFNTSTPTTLASIVNGSGKLVQQGSGALTLTATDGYTGETSITANSTLKLAGSGRIQSSSIVTDNGVLDISATPGGTSIQTLAGNGSVLLGNKLLQFLNGSTTFSGSITDGGAGGSVEFAAGDQILTGTNSWTGTTTLAAGATLTVSSPSSLGGGSLIFNDGSILKFTGGGTYTLPANFAQVHAPIYDVGSSTVTWSGQITGVGDLAVTGNGGTLVLTNVTNSYGGGTEVTGGAALKVDADGELGATATTLQLGDATTTGTLRFGSAFALNAARAIVLGAGGGIIDTNSNAVTIAQAITGGGLVVIGNGGALTLTGTNSYTGGTDVHGGATLTVNADGALGATAGGLKLGDATTAGTLRFGVAFSLNAARAVALGAGGGIIDTNGNATTIAQAITGGGLVVIGNGGALTLTGANSYAGGTDVHGGAALTVNADGALGATAGGLKLGDATTAGALRFANAFSLNAARAIALGAGGGIIDTNGNTTTIAQAITGGGLTKTGAGNLILAGINTFTGPAVVNAGTLSVNGAIASSVAVNSGGTLGGTGTVGATTVVSGASIAPGNSIGTLHVNGNLTLASGSVTAIEVSPAAADQIAVSGTAALGGTLQLNAAAGTYVDGVDYKLISATGLTGTFATVTGGTFSGLDQTIVYSATAVDLKLSAPIVTPPVTPPVNPPVTPPVTPPSVRFLFDTYGKTPNQIAAGAGLAAGANTGTLYVATGNLVATNVASVPGALGQMAGDIHASIRGAVIEDSRIIRNAVLGRLDQDGEHAALWGSAFGGTGSIAGDGNAAALHHNSAGLIAGVDMLVSDGIRAGIAAAYSTDRAATSGHLSTGSGNSGHIIGYAGWTGGAFDLKLGGDYGWGTLHTARQVTALGQTLAGRQDQRMGQVFADAGYRIASDQWMFEPYVDIAHVEATSGSFAERGGSAALSGGSVTDGLTYGTMGLRAALAGLSLDDIGIAPKIDLGWRHAFDTLKPGQLVSFQDTGTSFTVLGVPLGTDAAALQLGFDVVLTPDAKLSLGYDGTFGSRAQNNAVRGAFQWAF
jgi:autotransporter-associated beta strand protein